MASAAASPDAARAVPAALGCIEAALGELTVAAVAMEQTTTGTTTACAMRGPRRQAIDARMRRGYSSLQLSLDDAAGAAAARSLAARALEGAGALHRGRERR